MILLNYRKVTFNKGTMMEIHIKFYNLILLQSIDEDVLSPANQKYG